MLCTHANIFACFQHAQQPSLRGERQFAHLVEEYGAFVGGAEISLALVYCAGERAFFMPEKFAVDGAFGYGAAVYCKIFVVLSR